MQSRYVINTMDREQLDIALDWAAQEGWNPGIHDADNYYRADPNGFFVGVLDGQPIATISAIRYGDGFGFLGFYIVHPNYRGAGYGMSIWQHALNYLQGRTVALDGVVAQQENYQRAGFRFAYRQIRYQGVGGSIADVDPAILPITSCDLAAIGRYSEPFFPAPRGAFVESWVEQPDGYALALRQGDQIAGYGVMRRCRSGYKVGPLFADTAPIADALLSALKAKLTPADTIYLDLPEPNAAAVTLAAQHQMTRSFETARMYLGSAPTLPLNRTFGITSFEVG